MSGRNAFKNQHGRLRFASLCAYCQETGRFTLRNGLFYTLKEPVSAGVTGSFAALLCFSFAADAC